MNWAPVIITGIIAATIVSIFFIAAKYGHPDRKNEEK